MDRLEFPFMAQEAAYALDGYVDYSLFYGVDTPLKRFVAIKDLDETTGDAITWIRGEIKYHPLLKGKYGLIVAQEWGLEGNCLVTPDPHRAFFTLMRMVYGDDYEPDFPVVYGQGVRVGVCTGIGGPGFGHVPEMGVALKEGERRWRVPHIGRVVIDDDVDIGDNTTINRGCLGDTIIRRGAKIDSHVFIAHNAEIGEDAVVVAGAIICGSAKIGKGAWIAAGACIRNGVTVGDGATVGLMANVVKDVPAGATVVGNPAREI